MPFLSFFLLFYLALPSRLISNNIIVLNRESDEIKVEGNKVLIFQDKTCKVGIMDILQYPDSLKFIENSVYPTLNLGLRSSACWIKFDVLEKENAGEWVLSSGNPLLNYIDFYVVNDSGKIIKQVFTGNMRPYFQREEDHRHYIFYLPPSQSGPLSIYMRFKSEDAMMFILRLNSMKNFARKNYNSQLIEGLYFGIMLIMALYNLFLFFATKELSYFHYVIYIFSLGLIQFAMDGFAIQYLMQGFPWISGRFGVMMLGVAIFSSLGFMQNFIPRLYIKGTLKYFFLIVKGMSLFLILLTFLLPLNVSLKVGWGFALLVVIPLIVYVTVKGYLKGYKPIRYLILGWGFIFIVAFFYAMANFGIIPFNFYAGYGLQIGTVLDVLFMSFALADRINILRMEKQEAQLETIRQLDENRILLEQLNREQEKVFGAFLEGEENERKRLASELHDGIGQLLSVVKLNLSTLDTHGKERGSVIVVSSGIIDNITILIDEACREIRNVSHNLMPASVIQMGLLVSLEEFCKKINMANSIKVHFQNINFVQRLDYQKESTIYRVVQEIVNNAMKHSKATDIHIQLVKETGYLSLLIEDNGRGFDTSVIGKQSGGLGIKNIISRIEFIGGKVVVDSSFNKGTIYNINIAL